MDSAESQDKFKDNTFSYQDWSAETLKSTDEVLKHMKGLDIIGHQITDIRVVGGYASDFLERNFSETVCDFASNLTYTERKGINPYVWHDPYALSPRQSLLMIQ